MNVLIIIIIMIIIHLSIYNTILKYIYIYMHKYRAGGGLFFLNANAIEYIRYTYV